MIIINSNSIVGRIIQRKTCSIIVVTNYEKCSVSFLELISKLSFVINTSSCYPDLICVIPNESLDEVVYELARISSFCKIEQES